MSDDFVDRDLIMAKFYAEKAIKHRETQYASNNLNWIIEELQGNH
jgi:hypothetical protein